jgi:hypothetical protein
MNRLLVGMTLLVALMMTTRAQAQNAKQQIRSSVAAFVSGGDAQDVAAIDAVLHESYRIVWHDGTAASPLIVDKASYLDKIRSKEWGGDQRRVAIDEIVMTGEANATVKATLSSDKADFHTQLALINSEGTWKIVQDLVTATFK